VNAWRLGTEHVRKRRQPFAHRRRLVVQNVVAIGLIEKERSTFDLQAVLDTLVEYPIKYALGFNEAGGKRVYPQESRRVEQDPSPRERTRARTPGRTGGPSVLITHSAGGRTGGPALLVRKYSFHSANQAVLLERRLYAPIELIKSAGQ
jgi:hypothetical protein